MVLKSMLGRVFGCLRGKKKSLQDNIQPSDHNVAANETLSESDSISVHSVYLVDSVSAESEASELITFEDCWSYAESVELVRYHYYTIACLIPRLTHLYYNFLLIRLLYVFTHYHYFLDSKMAVAQDQ
jgi:hypothetical protein